MSDSSYTLSLGVGFLLGLRHALDADHLAAVSTVLAERPSFLASGAVGFWWGVGHTATLLAMGAIVFAFGIRISERFEVIAETGVGALLVVLGGNLIFTLLAEQWHVHPHTHGHGVHIHWHSHRRQADHHHRHWMADSIRPLCIGMAHGLAGSAALMLVILASAQELKTALLFIAVFGAGSIIGMMVVGLTISLPIVYSMAFSRRVFAGLQWLAGTASLCVGGWMLTRQALLVVAP
ncbi:MAG: hypothetical protein NNA20_00830 [Nitrospira sp.]|nr:hypothetical protein [Nitrospira sp.]